MKRVRIRGVQTPTPSQQQGGLHVHGDGFSSNNMRLNSSLFGILEGNTVTPHQSLKQCCYVDLKKAQFLIWIYHEKS